MTLSERYEQLLERLPDFDVTEYEMRTLEEVVDAMGAALGIPAPWARSEADLDTLIEAFSK